MKIRKNRAGTFFLALLSTLLLPGLSRAAEFFFEKDPSLPLVYVTAAFRGGATQDPDQKCGATDIMGRLMLRGTKSKSKQQIDLALDQLGASIEVETRAEFITFRGMVLSENLGPYLSLLSEILTAPSFRAQELERLKKEQVSQLLNELNQDRTLVRMRFDETFFKGHPYSKPNDGKIRDIQNLSTGDIQKQYQKLISSSQMVLLAAGDASKEAFGDFLKKIGSERNTPGSISPLEEFNNPPSRLKVVIFDKPDRTQTQVLIGQKGVTFKMPELDALQIANHAFGGGGFQARLMIELRVKRGWTYGAGSSFRLGSTPHSWKVGFFPKNADTPPAIKEALGMIATLKEKGISEEEFDASRKSILNSAGFTYSTPAKRMENRLTEVIFGLPEGYFRDYADRIRKISRDDVNTALKKFIEPSRMMVGIVATAKTSKAGIAKALGIPEKDIEVQSYQKE
ncbi:MAG: insulinase family protein [Proteobacteria bacterium]|nr:insulinase family protein [Pseudomonadota bacterium]